jgi:hypothetical protein
LGVVVTDPEFVCTFDLADLKERTDLLSSLARKVVARRRNERAVTLVFPSAEVADVRAFVAAESKCCPFFTFNIDEVEDTLHLTVATPRGGEAMLGALEAAFDQEGTRLQATFQVAAR